MIIQQQKNIKSKYMRDFNHIKQQYLFAATDGDTDASLDDKYECLLYKMELLESKISMKCVIKLINW